MSSDPLALWSDVTEWEGKLTCIVSDDHDIESSLGVVVGSVHKLATYEASVHLSKVGAFSWSGNGNATGTWAEKTAVDLSQEGFILISEETVYGGGSNEVRANLDFGTDVSNNTAVGMYTLWPSLALDMDVELTITHKTSSGLPGDPLQEQTTSSPATRTISFPTVFEPLPLAGSTITGAKTVGPIGSEVANLSWSLRPSPDPTPTPTVEIQIQNTASPDDDLVLLACQHPQGRMKVPCRIRLTSQETNPVTIALTNPDGRLRFPKEADGSKTLTLPPSGDWRQFQISGQAASERMRDAVINAHLDSSLGPVIGNKLVTVVSFRNPRIRLTRRPGDSYTYDPVNGSLEVPGWEDGSHVAVNFEADAHIHPPQVKCDAPQLANLKIAIIQDVIDLERVDTFDNPSIEWDFFVPDGTIVRVPKVISQTVTFDRSVHPGPITDFLNFPPLYHPLDDAVRPLECDEGATLLGQDTPHYEGVEFSQIATSNGAPVGVVNWNSLLRREWRLQFRTYCVVYDPASGDSEGKHGKYCALSQANWELSLDSSTAPNLGGATVHPQEPATSDPANTAGRATLAAETSNPVGIGPLRPIQKPATTP